MRAAVTGAALCAAALAAAPAARATVTIDLQTVPAHPVAGQPFRIVYALRVLNDVLARATPLDTGRLEVLANPGAPQLPDLGGYTGVGDFSLQTSVDYIVRAPSPGRYTVSGARAMDRMTGRTVASHPPLVIQVAAAPPATGAPAAVAPFVPPPAPASPLPPMPGLPPGFFDPFQPQAPPAQTPAQTPADPDEAPVGNLTGAVFDAQGFVRLAVDDPNPYVGQEVLLRAWLYVPAYDAGCEPVREPGLDGFWSEPLLNNRDVCARRWVPQTVAGHAMGAGLIRKIALFPTHAGRLEIGSMAMQVEYIQGDSFFGARRRVEARSPALTVDVREPPAEAQPSGYVPGTIGPLTLTAALDRPSLPVGETATLTVRAEANGYLGSVGIPAPAAVDGVRIHPGSSRSDIDRSADALRGHLTNEYLLVPTRPGSLPLGTLSVPWLDAATGRYAVARVVLPTLVATGAALARDADEAREDPATELQPFDPRPSLRPYRPVFTTGARVWGAVALPLWAFALALALPALRRRLGERRVARAEQARTDPAALLAQAAAALGAGDPAAAVALAGRALDRARREYGTAGLDDRGRAALDAAQAACDTARFAGALTAPPADAGAVLDRVGAAVAALEAQ